MKNENPHVVFDSNKIQHGSVIEHEYSPNGKYCAFTISDRSKSSIEIMVIDVEAAEPYGNRLQLWSYEKIAWSGDSQGFFIYVIILIFWLLPRFLYSISFSNCSMIQRGGKGDICTTTIWIKKNQTS